MRFPLLAESPEPGTESTVPECVNPAREPRRAAQLVEALDIEALDV